MKINKILQKTYGKIKKIDSLTLNLKNKRKIKCRDEKYEPNPPPNPRGFAKGPPTIKSWSWPGSRMYPEN